MFIGPEKFLDHGFGAQVGTWGKSAVFICDPFAVHDRGIVVVRVEGRSGTRPA
jgi:hypothetical protein